MFISRSFFMRMVDRISDLPHDLLHHILSFLRTTDKVRTSILSKLWKNIWISSPVLEVDASLSRFLEQTVVIRHRKMIPISKLVIYLPFFTSDFQSLLERSISYAIDCNIRQLELFVINQCLYIFDWHYYDLPDSVLDAKSLTVLNLRGFKLKSPPTISSNIRLSLQKLHLEHVWVDDQLVQSLLARCPNLEDLSLKSCRGLKNLKISGLYELKRLSLERYSMGSSKGTQYTVFETVNIEAFRLQSFYYCGDSMQYSFACKNVKILKLSRVNCNTKNWLLDTLSNFPLLEVLRIESCTLKRVKISCHLLKILYLERLKNVFKIEIDTPNLHSFTFQGYPPASFSSNALSLTEANIIHSYSQNIGTDSFVKVAEFHAKFNHCKVLNLHGCDYKSLIIPKELRTTLLPPLYNIKHLTLSTCSYRDPLELVQGLLWTSPRPQTLSIICYGQVKLSMKFLYENQVEKEETTCFCASLPIICWRHCLKELKIKKLERIEDQRNLKNFFVENAKILEKINGLTDCNL